MKIVVIGGSGRIGEMLVRNLRQQDCRVVAASPTFGVDTLSGAGLADALEDAEVVVDVSNSRSLDAPSALRFFEISGRNLLAAGRTAGVRHHIALSIVGVDRLAANAYFHAKRVQEDLIRASGIPFTIVRSTQFFEFIGAVVQEGSAREIPISPALVQPIAAEDVADALADCALAGPLDATIEIAGPERFRLDVVATAIATAYGDGRQIVSDVHAPYFGAELEERSLLPHLNARLGRLKFEDWLRESLQPHWSRKSAA